MSLTFPLPKPAPFLQIRSQRLNLSPQLCGLCVGYELKAWRVQGLANHIIEWLPEFALTASEIAAMQHANSVAMIRKAANTVYQTKKFAKRGEFGELFLHAAIRQVYDSLPAISKIYYKSANNDPVKGFDAVHVVGPPNDLELWLGEAKFYDKIAPAISDSVKEIEAHLGTDYLRDEFVLISNKLDVATPHSAQLALLLNPNTSLDVVFKRVCIPVLLTYESDCVSRYNECSTDYVKAFEKELETHHAKFQSSLAKKKLPPKVRVNLFLMPLHQKKLLVAALDAKLKAWQKL
jgi:hypothetical protein